MIWLGKKWNEMKWNEMKWNENDEWKRWEKWKVSHKNYQIDELKWFYTYFSLANADDLHPFAFMDGKRVAAAFSKAKASAAASAKKTNFRDILKNEQGENKENKGSTDAPKEQSLPPK